MRKIISILIHGAAIAAVIIAFLNWNNDALYWKLIIGSLVLNVIGWASIVLFNKFNK